MAGDARANNFDSLRAALAATVILSHSYSLTRHGTAAEPVHRLTGGRLTLGALAVDGFFAISGYLIASSWLRSRGPLDYLRRRALRIYPGFLACCLSCACAVGPLAADDPGAYWREFSWRRFAVAAIDLRGVETPPVFGHNPLHGPGAINGSLWSIRPEAACYLGLAALGLAGLLRRVPVACLLTLACLAWGAHAATGLNVLAGVARHADMALGTGPVLTPALIATVDLTPEWPRLAACFLAGATLHLHRDRIAFTRRGLVAAPAAFAILSIVAGRLPMPAACLPAGGAFAAGIYALFAIALAPAGCLSGFARRADLSYGLYLYAFPVQQLIVMWSGNRIGPPALFALALPATAMLALASWHLVERPCLRLKGRGASPG